MLSRDSPAEFSEPVEGEEGVEGGPLAHWRGRRPKLDGPAGAHIQIQLTGDGED